MVTWGSWVVVMVFVGCGYGGVTQRMWTARHEFEIKARSPTLIFVSSMGGFAAMMMILLQWRSRALGSSLPCTTMAYVNPCVSVFMAAPFCFRAVRLIVAHNPEYRYKFARFIKWKPLMLLWTLLASTVAMETALMRHAMPRSYCFVTDPFLVGITTASAALALFLARSLRNVYDAFGIRQELERVLWIEVIFGVILVLMQVLVVLKTVPNSVVVHIFDEIVWLFVAAQVGIWSMMLPLASHKRWYQSAKRFLRGSQRSSSSLSQAPIVGGVLDLAARSGDIGVRFGDFCEKNHVLENWEFILNVVAFKKISPGTDDQYRGFAEIVDQFITSTSPAQINIASDMRRHILAFGSREAFSRLDGRERRKVLDKPLDEIVRLLEFNLLEKFWQAELRRQDDELADIAKEDKNLMEIIVSGEESAKGGRRGSFVNASRQKSSKSLSSHPETLSPGPTHPENGSTSKPRRAEQEPSPDAGSRKLCRGTSQLTTPPSSNSSSLQTLEEKHVCATEICPGSRERPFFPYTRRSSQIRPLLSSIEASIRAASEDQSGARVSLDDVT